MASATLPFFPAFCSVYSAHLRATLSKDQGSFFIQPMKATLGEQAIHRSSDFHPDFTAASNAYLWEAYLVRQKAHPWQT